MSSLKKLMKQQFVEYASYVILERAVPRVDDGLKPVQRRILHTLKQMHDGKLHKVANIVGQTMAYHPHGDAPIGEALINLSNKGYLLDQQGNFGNLHTGDPAAAARYIEARLSPLALEVVFNPALTQTVPSYDSRSHEPVALPVKIPLLLLQGAEGIAVGMATHILPHNFVELLEAEIAILENRPFTVLPDFLSGGLMDASGYDKGRGKVRLRTRFEMRDPKSITITELCYGTTTESLIRSIDEAAKRGKLKLEAINDYTAGKVEIELKLPRGHYAEEIIDSLYAYTECEVTLHPQMVMIKDNLPCEMDVEEILRHHCSLLQGYLRRELEIEQARLHEEIFQKSLERLFIEKRLYLLLEDQVSEAAMHSVLEQALTPFYPQLSRVPQTADLDKLLNIPVRRISRYDVSRTESDIQVCQKELRRIEKQLSDIVKHTINYLQSLLTRYGQDHPRRTECVTFTAVDRKAMERQALSFYYDPNTGFVGTKVTQGQRIEGSNFDKLLYLFQDGSYSVTNLPEKLYLHGDGKRPLYVGIADKQTILSLVYREKATGLAFAKRFVVTQYILDKVYRFVEDDVEILFFSSDPSPQVEVVFVPKVRQKVGSMNYTLTDVAVKGVAAKGIRLATRPVKKVSAMPTTR